jgi:hypothetical protein
LLFGYFSPNILIADRVNEYSDDDEEFSSGEENDEGLGGYAAKRNYAKSNYRKMTRPNDNDGDLDDSNLVNNPVDSDSEFENLNKEKGGSRAKMSRVSSPDIYIYVYNDVEDLLPSIILLSFNSCKREKFKYLAWFHDKTQISFAK